jgi:transcription elongation factor GreA
MRVDTGREGADDERVVTRGGYERLLARLRQLEEMRQPEIAERLRQVRAAESDLSDSAEYRAAVEQAEELEHEIADLRRRVAELRVLRRQRGSARSVGIGSRVTLAFEGDRMRVQLVGVEEADPLAGRVSARSPLGRALVGHAPGDTVRWSAPDGEITARIVAVA